MPDLPREVLSTKLDEAVVLPPGQITARDVRLPRVPGKALAVIGVRRGGKTSYLHQLRAERLADGRRPESQLLIGLEDERLVGVTAQDLGWMVAEHERRYPDAREGGPLTDERMAECQRAGAAACSTGEGLE